MTETTTDATIRTRHEQIDDAVENLQHGRIAKFTRPGHALTYYLREIVRDRQPAPFEVESSWTADCETGELEHEATVPPPAILYASWYCDWLTGELHTGDVLRFSIDAPRQAAVATSERLDALTQDR